MDNAIWRAEIRKLGLSGFRTSRREQATKSSYFICGFLKDRPELLPKIKGGRGYLSGA